MSREEPAMCRINDAKHTSYFGSSELRSGSPAVGRVQLCLAPRWSGFRSVCGSAAALEPKGNASTCSWGGEAWLERLLCKTPKHRWHQDDVTSLL